MRNIIIKYEKMWRKNPIFYFISTLFSIEIKWGSLTTQTLLSRLIHSIFLFLLPFPYYISWYHLLPLGIFFLYSQNSLLLSLLQILHFYIYLLLLSIARLNILLLSSMILLFFPSLVFLSLYFPDILLILPYLTYTFLLSYLLHTLLIAIPSITTSFYTTFHKLLFQFYLFLSGFCFLLGFLFFFSVFILFRFYMEEDECLICFNQIQVDTNEHILLECCNKQLHIDCLCTWIKSCDNTYKLICPYCRQKSKMIDDMYNSLNIINNSYIPHNIDFRHADLNNVEILNLHNLDGDYCSFYKCIYKIYVIIVFIVIVVLINAFIKYV